MSSRTKRKAAQPTLSTAIRPLGQTAGRQCKCERPWIHREAGAMRCLKCGYGRGRA